MVSVMPIYLMLINKNVKDKKQYSSNLIIHKDIPKVTCVWGPNNCLLDGQYVHALFEGNHDKPYLLR